MCQLEDKTVTFSSSFDVCTYVCMCLLFIDLTEA